MLGERAAFALEKASVQPPYVFCFQALPGRGVIARIRLSFGQGSEPTAAR
jgi:hypothetical protein